MHCRVMGDSRGICSIQWPVYLEKSRNLWKFQVKKKVVALLDSFSFCLKRRTKVKCPVYREISGGLGRYFLHHFQLIFNHFQGPLNDKQ